MRGRTMKRLSCSTFLILVSLFLNASLSASAEKKFEKKFPVSSGGTFTIKTDVGDVDISGTSEGEVSITALIRGSEREVDGFDISAWQNDQGVEVKGRNKHSGWFSWFGHSPDVKFTVAVPREYSVKISTSGGGISITGLKGKVEGETSGGDLNLHDLDGPVKLETSGGKISGENLAGTIHLETSGGDIQVTTVAGDIDVNTSGGNIKMGDIDGKVTAETSGGDVVVRVKNGNKGIHAETSGGNIDILVPKDVSATIDASTSGGEVRCDLPVTMSGRFSESRVRGTVNGGGNSIHAYTSGGDVRIRTAE